MGKEKLINDIISSLKNKTQSSIISKVRLGESQYQNELLMFIKPELFLVENVDFIKNSLSMIIERLNEFDVVINGIITLSGEILEKYNIMNNHYGYINQLSRFASNYLKQQDKKEIITQLSLPENKNIEFLGGHEYLKKFPEETPETLDLLWFSKKSIKLRSGFYFQCYTKNGQDFILINGFHPSQLEHFTNKNHHIVLMVLNSNTSWKTLKTDMVGTTFPEKASPESIRGILYKSPDKFGLNSVSIANNGVHLSAGPFEAMYEIQNFLGNIARLDIRKTPPNVLSKLLKLGKTYNKSIEVLKNPDICIDGNKIDLFSATEDLDTDKAISLWIKGNLNV